MTKLISDFILAKNFTRFGHKILIRNETSHTLITKSELILIIELKENGVLLEVPINICQKGHNLTLFFLHLDSEIKFKLPNSGHLKEALFEAISKVESIEKNANKENRVCIDIHFTQYDVDEWKEILNQYKKKQEDINKLMLNQHIIRDEK